MKEFARALLATEDDPLTCGSCQALLGEYVERQLLKLGLTPEFAAVAEHLRRCPNCTQAMAELSELLALAYAPAAAEPFTVDLSFLPSVAANEEGVTWWDDLGRFVIRFSADLLASLQPPAPALGYAGVKSTTAGEALYQLSQGDAEHDLTVDILVRAMVEPADQCVIDLGVDIPSRGGWPHLGEIMVSLKQGDQVLAQKETDAFGHVEFRGVDRQSLTQLRFEIDPG